MKALVILNPYAGAGPLRHFDRMRTSITPLCEEMRVVVTMTVDELEGHLRHAAEDGFDTVMALGGDGTNLAIISKLLEMGEQRLALATLPLGTGRDFARTLEIPLKPDDAVAWLKSATPHPVDVGQVSVDGKIRYFLNGSSSGLSGEIARRVNSTTKKRPWTFLQHTVQTLLQFGAPRMTVEVDGKHFFEGEAFILTVGNGRYFGRGMKAHPDAFINDGLFDVILIEGMPKTEALTALPTLMKGTHIHRDDVHVQRGSRVRVVAHANHLDMETDGESAQGKELLYTLLPGAIRFWIHPDIEAYQNNRAESAKRRGEKTE